MDEVWQFMENVENDAVYFIQKLERKLNREIRC
jgi:hypothetical protein